MPEINRSEMAAEYGLTLSFLKSNKELRALFDRAVKQTWDPSRFQAAVRNTNWYKKTAEPWRNAQVLKKTDPATYDQRLAQVRARVTLMATEYGAKMSAKTFNRFAEQVFAQGMDDNQVRRHLAGFIEYREGRLLGQAGQWEQEIRGHMRDMGVMWTDKTIKRSVARMVQGGLTVQDVISQVNESAKGKFAHLAKRIDQGETLYDIASPFMQEVGQILEINPETLTVDNPLIKNTLDSWGLRALYGDVMHFLREGFAEDRIFVELQETAAWKQRFAGNEMRKKAGMPVLSPAEYLSVEASYKQVMESAGLPQGFYDDPTDFANWIGKNVAPTEVKNRVDAAVNFVSQAPKEAMDIMRQKGFTDGELYAFALDQKKTERMVTEKFRAVELQGRFQAGGARISGPTADRIAAVAGENAVNRDAVQQGVRMADQGGRLAGIYGERYDANQAARDVFLQDVEAGNTRRRLASQERGAFSGSGAVGENSLNTRTRT